VNVCIHVFRGTYDILVNGKKVGAYDNQGSFGELALMYNMPRAATIVAMSDGRLWAVVHLLHYVTMSNTYSILKFSLVCFDLIITCVD